MLSANTDPCASNLNHHVHKNKCVHCFKHINAWHVPHMRHGQNVKAGMLMIC